MGTYEVIVVGLGAMGSAALHQLAARGVRALGIDQHAPPHALGSTHGDTRITRLGVGEGMAYVPLASRSQQLWREVEAETGEDLLSTNGCLILGRAGAGFGFHGSAGFLQDTIAAAEAFGIPHETLTAAEVRRRHPQFTLVGDELAYFEPGGGLVRPEACVRAQLGLAEARGAAVLRDVRVGGITAGSDGVVVRTTAGDHAAARVVLTAGPWIGDLVGDELRRRFTVRRQVMHWFDIDGPVEPLTPPYFPVYIWALSAGAMVYGMPAVDGPHGGMKVATEHAGPSVHPDSVDRMVTEEEAFELFDGVVGPRFAHLRRRRVRSAVCLYTTTVDGDFVIDWQPDNERVLVVSACSGHGFKHSAAIGEAAAELVADGVSTIDLSAFALRRFDG